VGVPPLHVGREGRERERERERETSVEGIVSVSEREKK